MSTLQVKGGSGPAGRTLKTLNNKNNLASLYMKKQLDQLHREKSYCISHLDRDKFAVQDFLQQVQRTDSDKHPAALKYLGKADLKGEFDIANEATESTPRNQPRKIKIRRRSRRVKPEQRQMTPTEQTPTTSNLTETADNSRVSSEKFLSPIDRQKTFLVSNKPSIQRMNSTISTLPSLDSRRQSVYFQIASTTAADISSDSDDGDDGPPTIEVKTRDLSNRRRSSFVAWVQENSADQEKKLKERLINNKLKESPLEQRRNSFANFMQSLRQRKSVAADPLQEVSERNTPVNNDEVFTPYKSPFSVPGESPVDMMRSIMLNKEQKKVPLPEKIDLFYNRISHLKIPVHSFNGPPIKLTALERRRYTLLTKGIHAALAESSDEED